MAGIGVKAIAGIASAGALGGAGYGIYSYNNTTDTVENYLKKNNLTLRTTNWETVLEAYKLEKTSQTEIQTGTINAANVIKTWCEKNLKNSIKSIENDLFKKASLWCIEFKSIKEQLGNKKLEEKEATLNSKLSSFSVANQEEIKKIEQAEDPNKVGKQIKQWCSTNSKRRYSRDDEAYFKDINANCLTAN